MIFAKALVNHTYMLRLLNMVINVLFMEKSTVCGPQILWASIVWHNGQASAKLQSSEKYVIKF